MRRSAYPFLAVSSAGIALAGMLSSAVRLPHYGGTLRVEIQAKASSLDPAEASNAAEANAIVRLRDLIYNRLVRLDRNGQPQPSVSLAWEHDARSVNWDFKLRRRGQVAGWHSAHTRGSSFDVRRPCAWRLCSSGERHA